MAKEAKKRGRPAKATVDTETTQEVDGLSELEKRADAEAEASRPYPTVSEKETVANGEASGDNQIDVTEIAISIGAEIIVENETTVIFNKGGVGACLNPKAFQSPEAIKHKLHQFGIR